MTTKELRSKYTDDCIKLRKDYHTAVNDQLIKTHLNGLVKRKEDGKIGWLCCKEVRVEFYPRTKNGTPSSRSDGWVSDAENEFEPYTE